MASKVSLVLGLGLLLQGVLGYRVTFTWSERDCKGQIVSQIASASSTCEPIDCRNTQQGVSQSYSVTCPQGTLKDFPYADYGISSNSTGQTGQTYAVFETYPTLEQCNADTPQTVTIARGDATCQSIGGATAQMRCLMTNQTLQIQFYTDTNCQTYDGELLSLPFVRDDCINLNSSIAPNFYCTTLYTGATQIPIGNNVPSANTPTASPANDSSQNSNAGGENKSSGTNLAGPIAGGVVGVVVILAGAFFAVRYMRKKEPKTPEYGQAPPAVMSQQPTQGGWGQPASIRPPDVPEYHVTDK
ncbi:hypothetical protein HK097_004015 [Rhizophlyctis rosea]|uniref:Uncharacterized protein n=1 Tax=Rhizophlyctis rosea TaxID=64517 RepID=A0AAD5SL76_9FUNG|nr:hypothetical protein HK097_004015 [Rhizophlyctis rosea]